MKDLSSFQMVILGVLVLFLVIGVFTFAFIKGTAGTTAAEITVWGTLPSSYFDQLTQKFTTEEQQALHLTYVEKDVATFDTDLAEALAAGTGPDVFLLPQDKIIKQEGKIALIPYSAFSQRQFQDTFLQESELYLKPEGIVALPFIIDPLVMYYNRDLLSNAGIALPPQDWGQFIDFAKTLTVKSQNGVITRSALALGEYRNISNAKEILSTLIMQAGNPIVSDAGTGPQATLSDDLGGPLSGTESALRFYTQFGNPVNEVYSWNRSLPKSQNYFLAGDLAVYFGFASELPSLRAQNSNLNFDVAPIPQTKDSANQITFGKMYGLAIARNSPNVAGAFKAFSLLTSKEKIDDLTTITGLPPVRRDSLAAPASDSVSPIFYGAAIRSRAWLDPDGVATATIFQDMIESVGTGSQKISDAVSRASAEISALLPLQIEQ